MEPEAHPPPSQVRRVILIASGVLTIALLGISLYLALAPYVVFHSMNRYGFEWYHDTAPIIGEVALIPANVWAGSVIGPRIGRVLRGRTPVLRTTVVVAILVVGTLVVGTVLYVAFVVIYLGTVNWFVF